MSRRFQFTFPEGAIFVSCLDQKLLTLQEMMDFSSIRNHVLSGSSQRKYTFYHQNTLLDAFRTNSRSIISRNPSMVINVFVYPMERIVLDNKEDI